MLDEVIRALARIERPPGSPGVVPLRAGFPTATLVSVLDTVGHALTLAEAVVRELAETR